MVNRGASKNMVLIKNKKGVFFTTLVVVIFSLFLITITFYSQIQERGTIQKRVSTLNSFVFSVEKDIPRQLKATGFRIIFLFEKRIAETGTYITNLDSTFSEMFFNGTLYGQTNSEIESLMNGVTLPEIEVSLKEKAEKINTEINFTNSKIFISQEDPWKVKVTLNSEMLIKDKSNLVSWNKVLNISADIDIEEFEDPLYVVSTKGIVTNKIKKTPYNNFVQNNDNYNLSLHLQNSYYFNSVSAPSFLNRLEGINSPNENGIESLVNLGKLASQGILVKDKTAVDYIYFSDNTPSACRVVPAGMPSWFKLDSPHLSIYEVSCA